MPTVDGPFLSVKFSNGDGLQLILVDYAQYMVSSLSGDLEICSVNAKGKIRLGATQ